MMRLLLVLAVRLVDFANRAGGPDNIGVAIMVGLFALLYLLQKGKDVV